MNPTNLTVINIIVNIIANECTEFANHFHVALSVIVCFIRLVEVNYWLQLVT